jgi:hypothetical protein
MNLQSTNRHQGLAGILLIECMVYLGVLVIVVGIGFAAFYACWDNANALHKNADDITRALNVGEQWRMDIRRATGPITVENQTDGQLMHIPSGNNQVLYAFTAGRIERKLSSADGWTIVLPKVKRSRMETDNRSRVKAWRWEVELSPVRAKARLRPLFTFEAVPPAAS